MDPVNEDALLLPRLLIGLEALREQQEQGTFFPYPTPLYLAWNSLAVRFLAASGGTFPGSISGLLAWCALPIGEWFPSDLPSNLSTQASLLHPGGGIELTDSAARYLSESIEVDERIQDLANAAQIERVLQNRLFTRLMGELMKAANRIKAQEDYVLLRRFLIENPFTTTRKIVGAFSSTYLIKPQQVGELYRECSPHETYFRCSNCGPLFQEHGRWRGAKPDVCSDHLGGPTDAPQPVNFEEGLRHVLTAIHERICLHGIEEVRWLDTVRSMQSAKPDRLTKVEYWPGIDTYDMRLTFASGEVWAADMKEYRSAATLATELAPFGQMPVGLSYNSAFYVIPDRRELRSPGYCRQVREQSTLPTNHRIVTTTEFFDTVEAALGNKRKAQLK